MSKLSILKKSNVLAASNKTKPSREKLQEVWDLVHNKYPDNNDEIQKVRYAVKLAMDLLEKDTPMPANENRRCAKCDYDVTIRYCSNCGQKIEWESRKKDPIQPKTTPSKPMGRRKMNGGFEYD